MTRGLADIWRFVLPMEILERSLDALAEIGRHGLEGFVVWGGVRDGDGYLRFTNAIVPHQQGLRTPDGLLVHVAGDALFEVNKSLNDRGEILAGQVHTHPTDAFHSLTDDLLPIVTIVGGLSVVVPDFSRDGLAARKRFRWYRLAGYGRWVEIKPSEQVILT